MDDGDSQPGRLARNTRPRDRLGRPLPYGSVGVERPSEGVVRTPDEALCEAQRLLDDALPFHAHEVLEDAWKAAPVGERELWRGLAQLAVGVTHAARGNRGGAVALLQRGAAAIAPYAADTPHGLDIGAILGWCTHALERVEVTCPVELAAPVLRSR